MDKIKQAFMAGYDAGIKQSSLFDASKVTFGEPEVSLCEVALHTYYDYHNGPYDEDVKEIIDEVAVPVYYDGIRVVIIGERLSYLDLSIDTDDRELKDIVISDFYISDPLVDSEFGENIETVDDFVNYLREWSNKNKNLFCI